MTLQDFAQGKGWVGISFSRLLCPDTGVCMLPAEVGSVRVGAGCQGEPGWENEGKRDLGWGSGVPLSIYAWEVYLKCAVPSAASGAPHSLPHPQVSPGSGSPGWVLRVGAPVQTALRSAGTRLGLGKSSGSCAGYCVCGEREVASGDLGRWAGRPGCGWSGELLRRGWGGSLGVGEDRVGSMTLGGLRKTWGLSVWRGGSLNPWTLV